MNDNPTQAEFNKAETIEDVRKQLEVEKVANASLKQQCEQLANNQQSLLITTRTLAKLIP